MQSTSSTYNQIVSGEHTFQSKLVIDDVGTFGEDYLQSMSTSCQMLNSRLSIGKAISSEIEISMLAPSTEIGRMATLRPYTRAVNASQQSEWIPQGIFYIDTRTKTKNEYGLDILTIHGYDAMLKAEKMFEDDGTLNWSNPNGVIDSAMAAYIAGKMGVSLDPRNSQVWAGYRYYVPPPVGYTYREILGYIASFYAGCWVITETGLLRLITLDGLPPETNYLITSGGKRITFGGTRILV